MLDFAKALGFVNHRFLLAKLNSSGIDGLVLNWIKSYLSFRSYQFQIDGVLSDEAPCLSGVPQGSVFYLYSFCYIEMIFRSLSVILLSFFANDVKKVLPRSQSSRRLFFLSSTGAWAREWALPINPIFGNLPPLSLSFFQRLTSSIKSGQSPTSEIWGFPFTRRLPR